MNTACAGLLMMLSVAVAGCGSPNAPTPEPTRPFEPTLVQVKPKLQPGQQVKLWTRKGPERAFFPSPHDFKHTATVTVIENPFKEGDVLESDVYTAVFGSSPEEGRPTLWVASLSTGGTSVGASRSSVSNDVSLGIGHRVGVSDDGSLVLLLELGPD